MKKEKFSFIANFCWRLRHRMYFKSWLRHVFIAPFGRLRKPLHVEWESSFDGIKYPICPYCGNLPYDEKNCYFCGQRFIDEAVIIKQPKPKELKAIITFEDFPGGSTQ